MSKKKYYYAILIGLILGMPCWGRGKDKNIHRTRADFLKLPAGFKIHSPGVSGAIPYNKFGSFKNVGKDNFKYVMTDKKGLAKAAGEGIFPNRKVTRNPLYRKALKGKKLEGRHWDFVDKNTPDLNFFKWATAGEDPGVKLFYTAMMLERLGLIEEAIKAFYAVAVHFPKTISYTYYKTPWYVAPSSLDRVEQLLRRHREVKMELKGAKITIDTQYDNDIKNDVFSIDPGKLVNVRKRKKKKPIKLKKLKVVKTVGGSKVQLKKYENGHWKLFVEGKHFPIRAITYSVTPPGRSPDRGTWDVSKDWQLIDTNKKGIHDGFFESWVDENMNNKRDEEEKVVGDVKLLKDLGVNTFRAYHHLANKDLFRRLYDDGKGFYVLCGDVIGMYAIGSGATWDEGTDYKSESQRKTMLEGIRKMVMEYKDEPYILMWVLGNENVYGVANNADEDPHTFFEFVNEAAGLIKELDPTRPVVLANGDLLHLSIIKEKCPNIDVMGANAYRGEQGFGRHFFQNIKDALDRPVLVTEYGASSYADGYTREEAEAFQALYLANNWEDIESHMAGRGVGNALGGVLFEYMDEWWKANSDLPLYVQKERPEWYAERSAIYKNLQPENQDTVPQFGFPFLDGWSYEEWYGLVSQGDGKKSPFIRQLRPAYYRMKEMWNK